jgi:hypothetical protein
LNQENQEVGDVPNCLSMILERKFSESLPIFFYVVAMDGKIWLNEVPGSKI